MNKLGRVAVALAMAFSVGAASADLVINVPAGATATEINEAIQAVDVGGTVNLAEGTYTIDATIALNRGVTLKGAGRDATTLNGNKAQIRGVTISHASAVMTDLKLTAFSGLNSSYARGSAVSLSAGLIENCHVTGNLCCGYGTGCAGIYMSGGKVLNCIIDGNKADTAGGPDHSGAGIYMTAGTVEGCLIANNWSAKTEANYNNTYALTDTYGGGVYMSGASTLVNCTVYGNYARRNGGGVYVKDTKARLVNCLIADNDCNWADSAFGGNLSPASATNLLDHCLVGGASADHSATLGGWAALTDPANGDYTLSDASSGIGAGKADHAFERANDLAGNPRVHGGYADIGCYARVGEAAGCSIDSDRRVAVVGTSVSLKALRQYDTTGDCSWSVTCPDGSVVSLEGDEPALAFEQVGAYAVTLEVGEVSAERGDFLSVPLTNYVAAAATAAEYPFDTPEKATASLKDAVAVATDGSTVVVTGKVTDAGIKLFRDIAIVGFGPDETTVDGNNKDRIFDLNSPGARVENLTFRRGALSGYGYYSAGAGARIGFNGGTITKCCVLDCQVTAGPYYQNCGGIAMFGQDARLTHTRVSNCWCWNGDGAGVLLYNGLIDNCLIDNNTAKKNGSAANGGGVCVATGNGKVRNCTIVANNSTENQGGGVYFTGTPAVEQFVNCLIVENIANSQTFAPGKPDWAMATDSDATRTAAAACFVNCAFETCAAIGEGSVTVSAPFVDAPNKDYHVLGSAKSVEAGCTYEDMSETDLDGMPRVSGEAPDIGCYEVDKNVFAPTFDVSPSETMCGGTISLTPALEGAPEGVTLTCHWTFTNGAGYTFTADGVNLEQVFDHGGRYAIKMEVLNAATSAKIAEYVREDVLLVAAPVAYVTANVAGATPAEPFDKPETAHTNLNELLDRYSIDHCQILLDEGTHYITKTLTVAREITLSGAGQDKTFVKRKKNFNNSTRTFFVNHANAVVEQMTFTGATVNMDNTTYNTSGPLCDIGSIGGTVRHCTISNNTICTLYTKGVGLAMQGGRCTHCLFADNRIQFHDYDNSYGAVAVQGGLMDNCIVRNNRIDGPAGMLVGGSGRAYNCTVTDNVSTNQNTKDASKTGYQSSANGLYLMDSYGSSMDLEKCRVVNCIFANNIGKKGTYGPEFGWSDSTKSIATYDSVVRSCLFKFANPAVSVGTKCVNGDPMFVDAAAHDYHVRGRSPAKKKGVIESWMRDDACFETDFGGDPRLVQPYHMDMGAYETDPIGFKLLVR